MNPNREATEEENKEAARNVELQNLGRNKAIEILQSCKGKDKEAIWDHLIVSNAMATHILALWSLQLEMTSEFSSKNARDSILHDLNAELKLIKSAMKNTDTKEKEDGN